MELRVIKYFLAVAREQTVTGAAEAVHVSQPSLSRQIKDLEDELGKPLFIRGSKHITLTEEGKIFRKRAEEVMDLIQKTQDEIASNDDDVTGDIYIGAGESDSIRRIARIVKNLNAKNPDSTKTNIRLHIVSGDAIDISEKLDKGLFDFAVLFEPADITKYNFLHIPCNENSIVLMRPESPLAKKKIITPEDLIDKPLIVSKHQLKRGSVERWLKTDVSKLNIAGTFNLCYNASLMVEEGLGYALGLDKIINVNGNKNLVQVPFVGAQKLRQSLVWKKYQVFSKACELFLEEAKKEFAD